MHPPKLTASHGALVLACAAALVLGVGLVRRGAGISGFQDLEKSRDTLAAAVKKLDEQTKGLDEEITRLTKSPSYAKKVLRDKYHVTDPDEDIVFFAE